MPTVKLPDPPAPPGPPAPPPAPPVKRPVKIGGKVYPPGQLTSSTLPNGKILVTKPGKPDYITLKLKGKDNNKWNQGKVNQVLNSLESTQEPASDALTRDILVPINPPMV